MRRQIKADSSMLSRSGRHLPALERPSSETPRGMRKPKPGAPLSSPASAAELERPGAAKKSLKDRFLNHFFRFSQIFRRLVLGWMDSYDSNQILIFSDFSRSTRLAG